jgi:hypothetical protein
MNSINQNIQIKDCRIGDIIEIGVRDGYLESHERGYRFVRVTVVSLEEKTPTNEYLKIAWKENINLSNNSEKEKLCLEFKANEKGFKYASYFCKSEGFYCRLISRPKISMSIPTLLGSMLLSSLLVSKKINQEVINASF